jgi:hypothetical protein
MLKLCAVLFSLALSGCVTSAVTQLAGLPGPPSHQADRLIAAYQMTDGNIVLFVKGRIHGVRGESEFSLLLPRAEMARIKSEHEVTVHEDRVFKYNAVIGPSTAYMGDGWSPLTIVRERAEVDPYTISASREPVLYELPRALKADNGKGLREYWGNSVLVYVEAYPDQSSFRLDIAPDAQRIKGNASKWLPASVAADIVTLPLQAMWAALFVVTVAGEATAESSHR